MFAALTAAVLFADVVVGHAPLDNMPLVMSDAQYANLTNRVGVVKNRRRKPKPREDLTPVEAWHKFCRPDGKVEIPKDERPKPYKKEKPNPHKRKPRK